MPGYQTHKSWKSTTKCFSPANTRKISYKIVRKKNIVDITRIMSNRYLQTEFEKTAKKLNLVSAAAWGRARGLPAPREPTKNKRLRPTPRPMHKFCVQAFLEMRFPSGDARGKRRGSTEGDTPRRTRPLHVRSAPERGGSFPLQRVHTSHTPPLAASNERKKN